METNTKQWAKYTINLFNGKCKNGCIYCYRTADMARFKDNTEWCVKSDYLLKTFRKRDGLTMYPSSHDIRPEDINYHIGFLKTFLQSGSNILIVTKANLFCIHEICKELEAYKPQIEFRFTIGSIDNDTLAFYEPFAPAAEDRLTSLIYAFWNDYKTSVSIEPMLDLHPDFVVEAVSRFVTESIWIGKMNLAKVRLTLNGHADKWETVSGLVNWQANDNNILDLVERLSVYPKIRWKDSIQKVIDENQKIKKLCQA